MVEEPDGNGRAPSDRDWSTSRLHDFEPAEIATLGERTTGSALAAQNRDHPNDQEDRDAGEPEHRGNRVAIAWDHGKQRSKHY